jgi:hypothetical protein
MTPDDVEQMARMMAIVETKKKKKAKKAEVRRSKRKRGKKTASAKKAGSEEETTEQPVPKRKKRKKVAKKAPVPKKTKSPVQGMNKKDPQFPFKTKFGAATKSKVKHPEPEVVEQGCCWCGEVQLKSLLSLICMIREVPSERPQGTWLSDGVYACSIWNTRR